jgi:hypothetical protein
VRSLTAWKWALALCLFTAAEVRAGWIYHSTPVAGLLPADNGKGVPITLAGASGLVYNDSYILLATVQPTLSGTTAETFTHTNYQLALKIGDLTLNGTLYFTGELNGTVGPNSSLLLNNTFTGPTTQSLSLGNQVYTVTIGPFAPPAAGDLHGLSVSSPGAIYALATVSIPDVPEPSTLVLSGLALSVFGAAWWRRRRSARAPAASAV